MRTQRPLEKISTTISLVGLALGFSALGLLTIAKNHDGGVTLTGGLLGILIGAAFLLAAYLHWKRGDRVQNGFRVEEVASAEINSDQSSFSLFDRGPIGA
jgi:hypothetical protein